jgi:cyclophilin family peptidyl-prolyl cis-trans isomerase
MSRLLAAVLLVTTLGCPSSKSSPSGSSATAAATGSGPIVHLNTTEGIIRIQLDAEKAPLTSKNFLNYVDKGFYDGTVFHRVIDHFMIQGGGFTADLQQKATDAPVKNESKNGLKNVRGSIAMARTSSPDSATSQFFINVQDNPSLDYPSMGGYTVFGTVIDGMDVVDKIKVVPTGFKNGMGNVPTTAVVIQTAKRAP